MRDRKARNDNHFAMVDQITKTIGERRIHELHRIGTMILKGGSSALDSENFKTLLDMLGDINREDAGKLTLTDKLRILTIYLLSKLQKLKIDDPDPDSGKQVLKAFQDKENSLTPGIAAYVNKLIKTREDSMVKSAAGSKGSNLLGKVATKGFDIVSRAIKRDKASKIEEILGSISKQNYKLDKFEISTPSYNSLVEGDLETHLNCKAILIYSVDGGNWNEYEAVDRFAQSTTLPRGIPVNTYTLLRFTTEEAKFTRPLK
jgi:hypothetical protein